MAFFELPGDVRARIWSAARRRHLAAKAEALLARKAAALVPTPCGAWVARLEISPAKLMHVGLTMYSKGPQEVFELVEAGRVVERWWEEDGYWRLGVWGDRYIDTRRVFDGTVFGFDYSRADGWPAGHLRHPPAGPSWNLAEWWHAFNDWRESVGEGRIVPPCPVLWT